MRSSLPKIIVEAGSLKKLPALIKNISRVFVVVTDANLKSEAEALRDRIKKSGAVCHLIVLTVGEKTKSFSMVEKVCGSLARLGVKRDSCLIALGGGVVGDLTGFVASIYMRGIHYTIVPTTLLAMCDSSIGGKTGVDITEGKNMVGSFYHPALIVIDPLLLEKLPERNFRSGLAEVVKHAVISDAAFFSFLEKNVVGVLARKKEILTKIIRKSVEIKLKFVRTDEKESLSKVKSSTSRMMLNYGHTVGHALEQLSDYTIPHGEAVAIGMVAENRVAVGEKILSQADAQRVVELLRDFHLPTKIPEKYSSAAIKKAMVMDKKSIDGALHFALPIKIGKARIIAINRI